MGMIVLHVSRQRIHYPNPKYDQWMLKLSEVAGGELSPDSHIRGILSLVESGPRGAKLLALSIQQIEIMLPHDGLELKLYPHPKDLEKLPDDCQPLTPDEVAALKEALPNWNF